MIDMINMINAIEVFVGKTFQNWNYIAKFMKKYVAFKDHEVWIGSDNKIDNIIKETIK